MFTPETRRYIYGIVTAASPLIISAGIVSEGIVQQVLLVIAAVLGVSTPALAVANVPKTDTVSAPQVIKTEGAIVVE